MATEVENFENFEETGAQFVETVAPVVNSELPDIKLFGRWSCDEVQVSDMSLQVSWHYFHANHSFFNFRAS
jgi:small subunit ribosomal protein S5e